MNDRTASNDDMPNDDMPDPIAAAWADQNIDAVASPLTSEPRELARSVAKAHRKDQWKLLWLNVQEVVPSVVVAVGFGSAAPSAERPIAVVAAALLVLAVGAYLAITSIRHHRADRRWGTSVRDQLARRLAQLEHRAHLYRTIFWWYLLPLLIAIALFLFGLGEDLSPTDILGFSGLIGGFSVVIYLINRWYGRTRFESKIGPLEDLLAEFDNPPTD